MIAIPIINTINKVNNYKLIIKIYIEYIHNNQEKLQKEGNNQYQNYNQKNHRKTFNQIPEKPESYSDNKVFIPPNQQTFNKFTPKRDSIPSPNITNLQLSQGVNIKPLNLNAAAYIPKKFVNNVYKLIINLKDAGKNENANKFDGNQGFNPGFIPVTDTQVGLF